MRLQEIRQETIEKKNGAFLVTRNKGRIQIIPKNIDALDIVTICNEVSVTLCSEVKLSKFKMLRMFLKTLFKNNMTINNKNL